VDADGDPTIHDEEGMRHFYDAWGRWMDRWPGDPELSFEEGQKREAA
jgi:methanesulfonate monooxygenase large subunit